ncbi:TPA: hypothetical protein ACQK1M_002070 [Enterococcus hirae]|uniref:hypothetical protein n=1 Tax=Enterococcus hirae TaxID=1354 RepID=UPI001A967089|nr:hypothetical protein [Enterococcus hirae]MBO1117040.1 hypothetical protein [Enterococcus hirae]MBO1134994.1 hypothetical protein [Enterococcus hirae]
MQNKKLSLLSIVVIIAMSIIIFPRCYVSASTINDNEVLSKNTEVRVILEKKIIGNPNIIKDETHNKFEEQNYGSKKYGKLPQTNELNIFFLKLLGIFILCLCITLFVSKNKNINRYWRRNN